MPCMHNTWPSSLMPPLMPPLMVEFERLGVLAKIRVLPLTTRDPRRLLEQGEVDCAVGYFPNAVAALASQAGMAPIRHYRLYESEYVCVMRAGHPLAELPMTLDVFCAARHMLVSFSGRPYGFIDESLASLGRERQVVLTVNQFFTAGRVVANSNLLTVLPRHFVRVTGIEDQLVLQPLPFEVSPVHVEAVWHRRSEQRSAHLWLRQAIMRAAEKAFTPEG